VNLVDEHDRAPAAAAAEPLGFAHHLTDLLDPREHGAERHEPRPGRVGDDSRKRRLAGAGRAPEDDRLQKVALDRFAQRLPGRKELLLADELVEGPRPHPLGERRRSGNGRRSVGKE
jgi:hypothetical protein